MRGVAAGAVEVLVWWGVLVGVWLLTLSTAPASEYAVAAACALPSALVVVAARRALDARWRPDPRWLAWAGPLAVAILADTVRLVAVPLRRLVRREREAGDVVEVDLPTEAPSRSCARIAFATLALSATPGTFVLDNPRDDLLVIHQLTSGAPDVKRVVQR